MMYGVHIAIGLRDGNYDESCFETSGEKMKVYIVRDVFYGNIESIWMDKEEAEEERETRQEFYDSIPARAFKLRVEEWDVHCSTPKVK